MTKEKNKGGRPAIHLTTEQKAEVPTLAAILNAEQIADYFGVSRTTFFQILDRDEEVSVLYKKGRARAIGNAARNIITASNKGNVSASIFYLKTQGGWKETQQLDLTSSDGSMSPPDIEWVVVNANDTNSDS
jgi:hypothetical protein